VFFTRTDSTVASTLEKTVSRAFREAGFETEICRNMEAVRVSGPSLIIAERLSKAELEIFRNLGPKMLICLADPKLSTREQIAIAKTVDFCLVGSIEHQAQADLHGIFDTFLIYWVPELEGIDAAPSGLGSTAITLFYHGNRAHLEAFGEMILPKIDELASRHELVLEAHYRISRTGRWRPATRLRNLEIQQVEWSEPNVWESLRDCDIGIVPNLTPSKNTIGTAFSAKLNNPVVRLNKYGYRKDDSKLRFKMSSNPGRIYPFGYFSKPVVADFYPSSGALIEDGVHGFLPLNPTQWTLCLERLIEDRNLRLQMAQALKNRVETEMNSVAHAQLLVKKVMKIHPQHHRKKL
jgi:hypothetical protein